MGATGEEPLRIFVGQVPADAIAKLREAAQAERPSLIIVDTLQRLVRVRDLNDYAQVTLALDPILQIARESGAHVNLVHHAKKANAGWGGDSILGSTAILGRVDTALIVTRSEKYRTMQSIQRYGEDLDEAVIELDPTTRTPRLAGSRQEVDEESAGTEIVAFLEAIPEPVAEAEIHDGVEGRQAVKRRALRQLVKAGKAVRTGAGKRGDSFRYALPGGQTEEAQAPEEPAGGDSSDSLSLVPAYTRVREKEEPISAVTPRHYNGNSRTQEMAISPLDGVEQEREKSSEDEELDTAEWGEL